MPRSWFAICLVALACSTATTSIHASIFEAPAGMLDDALTDFAWSDYTVRIVDRPKYFEPFVAPLVFINAHKYTECKGIAGCMIDACRINDSDDLSHLKSKIVVLNQPGCDLTRLMDRIYDAGGVSILQLYTADAYWEPNDHRYVDPGHDPRRVVSGSNGTFHVQRMHGIEPAQFLTQVLDCEPIETKRSIEIRGALKGTRIQVAQSPQDCTLPEQFDATNINHDAMQINMTVTFITDPWAFGDVTPARFVEKVFVATCYIVLLCITVQGIIVLKNHPEQRHNANGAPSAYNLQLTGLYICALLFVFRLIEFVNVQLRRALFIWSNQIVDEFFFASSLGLVAVLVLLLVLYWMELLDRGNSNRRMNIRTRNKYFLFALSGFLIPLITTCQVLYAVRALGYRDFWKSIMYFVLGFIALCESIGMIGYGCKVAHELKQAEQHLPTDKKQANRNKQMRKIIFIVTAFSQFLVILLIEVIVLFAFNLFAQPDKAIFLTWFVYGSEILFVGGMMLMVFRPSKKLRTSRRRERQQQIKPVVTHPCDQDTVLMSHISPSFVADALPASTMYFDSSRMDDSRDPRFIPDSSWLDGTHTGPFSDGSEADNSMYHGLSAMSSSSILSSNPLFSQQ